MTNIKIFMVCRKNEKRNEIEAKRFWEVQERLSKSPQNTPASAGGGMNAPQGYDVPLR